MSRFDAHHHFHQASADAIAVYAYQPLYVQAHHDARGGFTKRFVSTTRLEMQARFASARLCLCNENFRVKGNKDYLESMWRRQSPRGCCQAVRPCRRFPCKARYLETKRKQMRDARELGIDPRREKNMSRKRADKEVKPI